MQGPGMGMMTFGMMTVAKAPQLRVPVAPHYDPTVPSRAVPAEPEFADPRCPLAQKLDLPVLRLPLPLASSEDMENRWKAEIKKTGFVSRAREELPGFYAEALGRASQPVENHHDAIWACQALQRLQPYTAEAVQARFQFHASDVTRSLPVNPGEVTRVTHELAARLSWRIRELGEKVRLGGAAPYKEGLHGKGQAGDEYFEIAWYVNTLTDEPFSAVELYRDQVLDLQRLLRVPANLVNGHYSVKRAEDIYDPKVIAEIKAALAELKRRLG